MFQTEAITAAVFLAGGNGSRIFEYTKVISTPKQLIKVGASSSIENGMEAVISAFSKVETVIISSPRWVGNFQRVFPNSVHIVQDEATGNGGALGKVINSLNYCQGNLLVMNADHLFGFTRDEALHLAMNHQSHKAEATVLLQTANIGKPNFLWQFNEENRLIRRLKMSDESQNYFGAFIGVFMAMVSWIKEVLPVEINNSLIENREAKTTEILLTNVKKHRVYVCQTENLHFGINTVDDLTKYV